jgi:hypothetical protein
MVMTCDFCKCHVVNVSSSSTGLLKPVWSNLMEPWNTHTSAHGFRHFGS